VIDASTLRRLLAILTGWLDCNEREVVCYLIEEIASCAATSIDAPCS